MKRFDYQSAKAAGHSDEEIGAYLTQKNASGDSMYIDRADLGGAAPSDATASPTALRVGAGGNATPVDNRHGHEPAANPFGWMAPAGMAVGGTSAMLMGQPELAPPFAAFGGAVGTYADQRLNEAFHTPFAHPDDPLGNTLGIAGNAALGFASEAVPPMLTKAIGGMVGPAAYKAALHVSPTLRDEFPGINIPQEAWNRGAPRLNAAGVAESEEAIGRAARPVRARMRLANSRSTLGSVLSEGRQTVPATVPKDLTYEIGGWSDPQAGAMPSVDRLGPQGPPKFLSGLDYPSFPNAPGGRNAEAHWERPPSVEQSFETTPRLPMVAPRKVMPMEPPQTVTHRVYVPGEVEQRGLTRAPKFLSKITPSANDLLARDADGKLVNAPGLQRLVEGVQGNLAGKADASEVNTILDDWLRQNGGKTSLSDLYTLGQKAGAAGDWRPVGDAGGSTAQMAASPNFKLTGKELKLAINDYIDAQMKKAGVSGFREGNTEVQKAIAVRDAVREGGKVGPPRLNAENATKPAKWNAFQNPETLGDFGRWAGGKTKELPQNRIAKVLIGTGRAAASTAKNAPRVVPALVQSAHRKKAAAPR